MVFSDESRFCLFHSDGREKVWRRANERYNPDCLMSTVKFGGASVMVWGCFSWWGVGPLVVIEGTLNQDRYASLMETHLAPYLEQVKKKGRGVVFQEDNAPCHLAGLPTQWRQTHKTRRLPWPAQSPDMNPIEHLWDHLGRQVRKRKSLPTSSAGLAQALQDERGKIPLSVLRDLILGMPDRVNELKKARGWPTRY